MGLSLWAGGIRLDSIAPVGDLSFSTAYGGGVGGGFWTLSWSMALPRRWTSSILRLGTPIYLKNGGMVIGRAIMAEPDRTAWTFTADGFVRQGETYYAVDASGNPTTNASTALTQAVARGLPWKIGGLPAWANASLSTASESGGQTNTVSDVLNTGCAINGQRWLIDNTGTLAFVTDTTSPSWVLSPGTPSMESADDDYVSTLYLRYQNGTDSSGNATYAVVTAKNAAAASRWGVREADEDVTSLGTITSSQATSIAAAILGADAPRPAYTSAVKPDRGALSSIGGVDATQAPWLVRAGQMVRHMGWRNLDGAYTPGKAVDWIIGSTSWSQADGLTIAPVALAARTTASVLAQDTLTKMGAGIS